jgi:hypothetical protein
MRTHSDLLPLRPFVAIIEEAVSEYGSLATVIGLVRDSDNRSAERSSLYRRATAWRNGTPFKQSSRSRPHRQERIHFCTADRIVTRLLGPEAWHTRPELAELYER